MFYYECLADGSYDISDGSVYQYDIRSNDEFEQYVLATTPNTQTKYKTVEEIKKEMEDLFFYY